MEKQIVAIVDDDLDDLLLLTDALGRFNESLEPKVFYTPEDAIEALATKKELIPYCVFIDVSMPRIGGMELLKTLRAKPHLNGVKMIMYSTYISDTQREQAVVAGANYTYAKPVEEREYDEMFRSIFASNTI